MAKRKIRLLDETLRNGQQSLWATRMRTESMLPIADVIDQAGFDTVCVAAGVTFESAAMFLNEDPWERMRMLRQRMPNTGFDVLVRARNLWGWKAQPYDVQTLFLETLMRNGVESFKVFDSLNDINNMEFLLSEGKRLGFHVKGFIGFNDSPAYSDEYLTGKAKQFVDRGVNAIVLSDSPGVMQPDRAFSALSSIRSAIGDLDLHFHCHTAAGLAREACRQAIRAGTDVIWTAARPLAWGTALPYAGDIVQMAREEGCDVDIDEGCLAQIDDWFTWVAHEYGKPIPEDKPFDPTYYQSYVGHQIPGGMISNLVQQLADRGLSDRLPEVLAEAAVVRHELGYPHMSTPFSQFVGVQALMNVLSDERYENPPEALRIYARGGFGEPVAQMDQNVRDKLADGGPLIDPLEGLDEPVLPKIRAEYGPFESDEDLLLFLFLHPAAYQDFKKNRMPIVSRPKPHPVTCLSEALIARKDLAQVSVQLGNTKVDISN